MVWRWLLANKKNKIIYSAHLSDSGGSLGGGWSSDIYTRIQTRKSANCRAEYSVLLSEVLGAFSKFHKSFHNIFRAREVLFGDHWLSDVLCGVNLKPVLLEDKITPVDLEKEALRAKRAVTKLDCFSDVSFTFAQSFPARNRLLTENYLLDVYSMTAKSSSILEKNFLFSVEFDNVIRQQVVMLRCQDHCGCLKALLLNIGNGIEKFIAESLREREHHLRTV